MLAARSVLTYLLHIKHSLVLFITMTILANLSNKIKSKVQESKGGSSGMAFAQFSQLVRLPIPTNLDLAGALQTDLLVENFVERVRGQIRRRKESEAAQAQTELDKLFAA
jgi:hypothetical protein